MSIGVSSTWQHDRAWFDVRAAMTEAGTESPLTDIWRDDVISLTVTEEMGKADRASLRLLDRFARYPSKYKPFDTVVVSFGRKIVRFAAIPPRKLKMYVDNPSGGGDDNGVITYDVSLIGAGEISDHETKSYENMTKSAIVKEVMTTQLKILKPTVKFAQENDKLSDGQKVMQNSNAFRFLVRLSAEWNAYFRLGYDSLGMMNGFFVDALSMPDVAEELTTIPGTHLVYGMTNSKDRMKDLLGLAPLLPKQKSLSNVLSYSWKQEGINAMRGDAAKIQLVNGQELELQRTHVEPETGTVYRLNTERIAVDLAQAKEKGVDLDFVVAGVVKWGWKEIKYYYDPVTRETANQGTGIRLTAKLLGDPTLTAGSTCSFGYGFPDNIGATNRRWWIQKATHSFSSKGYFTDIELIDNYVLDPEGNWNPAMDALIRKDSV